MPEAAFPNPLYVNLPENKRLKIVGAVCRTLRPVLLHVGATRRDIINAVKLGNPHIQAFIVQAGQTLPDPKFLSLATAGGITAYQSTHGVQFFNNGGAAVNGPTPTPNAIVLDGVKDVDATTVDALFAASDDVTHTQSRHDPIIKTLAEYWSGLMPGKAQKLSASYTSGSGEVTVMSNQTLMVGQKLATAATGFPVDAFIVAIKQRTQIIDSITPNDYHGTTITMSHKASANSAADEVLDFGGSNLVGFHWHEPENAGGDLIELCI